MATKKDLQEIVDWLAMALDLGVRDAESILDHPRYSACDKATRMGAAKGGSWSFGFWHPPAESMRIARPEFRAMMQLTPENLDQIRAARSDAKPPRARSRPKGPPSASKGKKARHRPAKRTKSPPPEPEEFHGSFQSPHRGDEAK